MHWVDDPSTIFGYARARDRLHRAWSSWGDSGGSARFFFLRGRVLVGTVGWGGRSGSGGRLAMPASSSSLVSSSRSLRVLNPVIRRIQSSVGNGPGRVLGRGTVVGWGWRPVTGRLQVGGIPLLWLRCRSSTRPVAGFPLAGEGTGVRSDASGEGHVEARPDGGVEVGCIRGGEIGCVLAARETGEGGFRLGDGVREPNRESPLPSILPSTV